MKRAPLILSTLLCLLLAAPVRPQSAEAWTSVRTKNLFLIGNASEHELRQAAVWIELFHDAISRLLSKPMFNSSVPTVSVIFRSDSDFQPFKPRRQGKPADIAGYFQPGADVNYIAISLEPGSRDPLNSALHEYVHLYVKDHLPGAPLWLNEGLAEFYSTFEYANGEAIIGSPVGGYLQLLRGGELLPLATLFSVDHASAHYQDRDKRGIFYAESWALVHYLMIGHAGRRQAQLARYLGLLAAGVSVENSFRIAFQTSFETLEKELKDYVRGNTFSSLRASVAASAGYGGMETERLSEAEVRYYLGDLLLHIRRPADAEKYFEEAVSLDPNLTAAHAALGMLRVRQGRLADARRHLRRAAPKSQNHLVHYFYAYALSREGMDENGWVAGYAPETLREIRSHLQTAVNLAPDNAEAYHLLALVNLVANEQLEESVGLLKRAINLAPARQYEFMYVLAQVYLRARDFESGRRTLESILRQSGDAGLRASARSLLEKVEAGDGRALQLVSGAASKVVSVAPAGGVKSAGVMDIDASGTLPAVEQVLSRYVEALGGRAAVLRLTSRVARGRASVPGEFTGAAFESYAKAPDRAAVIIRTGHLGEMRQGFDGSAGWMQAQPGGVRRAKDVELAELKRDCDFYAALRLRENYAQVRLLGRVMIGYREAYLVEAIPSQGEPDKLYFETQTGMLIRWDGVRSGWRGRAHVEVYFDDWREVDGVKMPFCVTRSSADFTIVFMLEEARHNVAFDERVFSQPAAGRATR